MKTKKTMNLVIIFISAFFMVSMGVLFSACITTTNTTKPKTNTPLPTNTAKPTNTPVPTNTSQPTNTRTLTNTPLPTNTITASRTSTYTYTFTWTSTYSQTFTGTNTPFVPSSTFTPFVPSATSIPAVTDTFTWTITQTLPSTNTPLPTNTGVFTATSTTTVPALTTTATITSTSVPLVNLCGQVFKANTPVSGVATPLSLFINPGAGALTPVAGATALVTNGSYCFNNLQTLPAGNGYVVLYNNGSGTDVGNLWYWYTNSVPATTPGTINVSAFDVADIIVMGPGNANPPGPNVTLPATFSWNPRNYSVTATEIYYISFYDTGWNYVDFIPSPATHAGSYNVTAWPAGITTGTSYWWDVWIADVIAGFGESWDSRIITVQ